MSVEGIECQVLLGQSLCGNQNRRAVLESEHNEGANGNPRRKFMKTGLQCFVAMAVGRDDTDRVYARQIRPALTKAGIHPVFMGTLEHNDDIDKRIVKEIEKSHLVIADLTYARPSVYFEAGFAQRKVPVIYTVRRDHFRRKESPAANRAALHRSRSHAR